MVNWLSKLKSGISSTWSNIKERTRHTTDKYGFTVPEGYVTTSAYEKVGAKFDKEKFKQKFKLKPIKKYEFKDFTYKPRVQPIRTQRVTDLVLPSEYTGAPSQTVVISPETTYTSTSVPDIPTGATQVGGKYYREYQTPQGQPFIGAEISRKDYMKTLPFKERADMV